MMKDSTERFKNSQGHPGRDELIDFRCSGLWDEHYYREGYSNYQPPKTKSPQSSIAEEHLRRKVDSLATEVAELHNIVHFLIKEVRAWKNTSVRKAQSPTRKTPASSIGIGITEKELARVGTHS